MATDQVDYIACESGKWNYFNWDRAKYWIRNANQTTCAFLTWSKDENASSRRPSGSTSWTGWRGYSADRLAFSMIEVQRRWIDRRKLPGWSSSTRSCYRRHQLVWSIAGERCEGLEELPMNDGERKEADLFDPWMAKSRRWDFLETRDFSFERF